MRVICVHLFCGLETIYAEQLTSHLIGEISQVQQRRQYSLMVKNVSSEVREILESQLLLT